MPVITKTVLSKTQAISKANILANQILIISFLKLTKTIVIKASLIFDPINN